ncbi:hypothetical protein [Nocardia noduli]|nr:hypothetical protein [Nocardia noduli]
MELFVILGLVLLVAVVVGYRKIKGTDKNLDMSTGNPPANDNKD